jgi:hypothetical protein
MTHLDEYKKYGTISGWKENDVVNNKDIHWGIKLQLKDIKGETTMTEKIMIEIDSFLQYNNIDYLTEQEIRETSEKIIKQINTQQ